MSMLVRRLPEVVLAMSVIRVTAVLGAAASIALIAGIEMASAAQQSTAWQSGHNSRVRLQAGRVGPSSAAKPFAFVEIEMAPGWKTYWRAPGDAGGVPPQFDWSKSENLAAARVLFPAPRRLTDSAGDTVGYKDTVTLPVELTARDPDRPISLALKIEYGVCKDICIPAEAALAIEVPPGTAAELPDGVSDALEHVPRSPTARRADDPEFISAVARSDGGKESIVLTARFPGDAAAADAFVEAPGGIYLSLPRKLSTSAGGLTTFVVEMGPYDSLADLKGKPLTATLIGERGEAEATFSVD